MLRYLLLLLIVCTTTFSYAQSKKKKAKRVDNASTQSNSLAPYYPKESFEPKKKKRSGKVTYTARDKFYDRVEELEKEQKKYEKMMKKPQYSDPSYFGHKRPPKRRPPGKMKFCKECRIRH
jgi:cell division protein FtsN